jgi:hypothetical protein
MVSIVWNDKASLEETYLVGVRVCPRQSFDVSAKISAAAVLHVQVQLVRRLHVVPRDVSHNVCMLQALKHSDLCVQLFLFPLRHGGVRNLFACQDLARCLPPDLADDAK